MSKQEQAGSGRRAGKGKRAAHSAAGVLGLLAVLGLTVSGSGGIQMSYNPSYINVALMGATAGDDQDDTDAFRMAATGSNTIYVPAGEYVITEPLVLNSANLIGAGADKSVIIADFDDPSEPIIRAGRSSTIRDIQIRFKDGLVTGGEGKGERVAVFTAGRWSLQRGSTLSNVRIANVGTGLYSPGTTGDLEADSFSVTYDSIAIEDFSYRGVDFTSRVRTGNVFRNLYISSGRFEADAAFYFGGEESETFLQSLTVADTRAKRPIHLGGARALAADVIRLQNVQATKTGGLIVWEDSNGSIERLIVEDCQAASGGSVVEIGGAEYSSADFQTLRYLRIGRLSLSGLNPDGAADFLLFRREMTGEPFYIDVQDYAYEADGEAQRAAYEAFPVTDGQQLVFLAKGRLTASGPTEQRPAARLCPFYTTYEDTTLGRTVTWTGEGWQ